MAPSRPVEAQLECGRRDPPQPHARPLLPQVVARCLVKDPAARPSAAELLHHRFFHQAKGREYVRHKGRTVVYHHPAAHRPHQPGSTRAPA